ncbi:very short patch repair endonuclease [Prescottella equi]|uniref:very short patch repair endonuclease n=1 Tax=Rhodococcus hoagii TaxID=43767 RepID=UPI0022AA390A|nr:very short patch repair endonuclease [Prescottella equi]
MSGDGPVEVSTPGTAYQLTPGRSRNMRAVKRSGTKPEIRLRSALHKAGLRFRKDFRIRVNGRLVRPDIVFTKLKIAVFVDGCFWHSCPIHGREPRVNTEYWSRKLLRTAQRDREQSQLLEAAGWQAIRIWEHVDVEDAAAVVVTATIARATDDAQQIMVPGFEVTRSRISNQV